MRERLRNARWSIILPVLVYLLLTLTGASYSSIGIDALREDVDHPSGVMIGEASPIRSDEWATSTPALLRVMASGSTDDLNPLTADDQFLNQLPAGPASALVLPDRLALQLGPWLPDHMLYSGSLWIPVLLLALGAPAWFRRVTGSTRTGWFAVALLVLSPVVAWWSYGPIASLGPVFAACAAVLKADEAAARRPWLAAVWGAVGAVLLVRTVSAYPPWSVVLDSALVLTTVAYLLARRRHRGRAVAVLLGTAVTSVLVLGAMLLEYRDTLSTVSATIYPGQRRAVGVPSALQELFAAPMLGVLTDEPGMIATNQSEISSSYAVAFVWCALLAVAAWKPAPRRHRVAVAVMGGVSAVWLAWSMLALGTVAASVPVLNMVPQARAADVLGLLGIVLLCMVLPLLPDLGSRRLAVASATACGGVTAYAGSLLRATNIPTLSLTEIYVASIVVAVVALLITWRPRRAYGYVVAVAGAALLVWNVNPLLFGLADLRGSSVSRDLRAQAPSVRESGGVWATDSLGVDSLLASSGMPSMSGRQLAGPDRAAWTALSPGADEGLWNRGGSYVWFQWHEEPGLEVTNPSPDVIVILASPCTLADREPDLQTVVYSHELDLDCLEESDRFDWGDASRIVYAVSVEPRERG